MSYGKMNGFADIIRITKTKDAEGFVQSHDEIIASVRVYREGRHGSERWANLAAFSVATDLFRFRVIPGVKVTEDMYLVADSTKYEIESVDDHKGKGLYLEILARRVTPNGKCSSEDA